MDGFEALGSDLAFAWNTPVARVRETLVAAKVRDLEDHGMRLLRFEETLRATEPIDLQYALHFSPDYNYGLRGATASIEQIAGMATLKDASGSWRPLVCAYLDILELLRRRYGEPHASVQGPEQLVYLLDHTRETTSVMATWLLQRVEITHELLIAFTPKHTLRFSPVAAKLVVVNETGRPGLEVTVEFDGGSAVMSLAPGQDRLVDLPVGSRANIEASLGAKKAQRSVERVEDRVSLRIRRGWLTGRLAIEIV